MSFLFLYFLPENNCENKSKRQVLYGPKSITRVFMQVYITLIDNWFGNFVDGMIHIISVQIEKNLIIFLAEKFYDFKHSKKWFNKQHKSKS